jgi:hypothetical protein
MKVSWRGVRTSLERFGDMGGLLRERGNSAHCQVPGFMQPVPGTLRFCKFACGLRMTRRSHAALVRTSVAQLAPDTEAAQVALGDVAQVRAKHAFQLLAQGLRDPEAYGGAETTPVECSQVLLGIDAHHSRPGFAAAALLTEEPTEPDGEVVGGLGQVGPALDAPIELRSVPQQHQQCQLIVPGDVKRIDPISEEAKRAGKQLEDGDIFLPVLGQPGQDFHHVRGVSKGIEVATDGEVGILRFSASDHVEVAPASQHQPCPAEIFEVRSEATERAPRPLGDHAELAVLPRVERQDAVGLAEIHPAEHDGFAAIESL